MLDEVDARFGQLSELRRAQMDSIRWMVDLAERAGADRIILNGSFVTDIMEPNDVDCVLLFSERRRKNRNAFRELQTGLPFLDIALTEQSDFDDFVNEVFSADRFGVPKGMIEVIQ